MVSYLDINQKYIYSNFILLNNCLIFLGKDILNSTLGERVDYDKNGAQREDLTVNDIYIRAGQFAAYVKKYLYDQNQLVAKKYSEANTFSKSLKLGFRLNPSNTDKRAVYYIKFIESLQYLKAILKGCSTGRIFESRNKGQVNPNGTYNYEYSSTTNTSSASTSPTPTEDSFSIIPNFHSKMSYSFSSSPYVGSILDTIKDSTATTPATTTTTPATSMINSNHSTDSSSSPTDENNNNNIMKVKKDYMGKRSVLLPSDQPKQPVSLFSPIPSIQSSRFPSSMTNNNTTNHENNVVPVMPQLPLFPMNMFNHMMPSHLPVTTQIPSHSFTTTTTSSLTQHQQQQQQVHGNINFASMNMNTQFPGPMNPQMAAQMNIQMNPYLSYGFPHLSPTSMGVLGGPGRLPFDLPSPKRFKQN